MKQEFEVQLCIDKEYVIAKIHLLKFETEEQVDKMNQEFWLYINGSVGNTLKCQNLHVDLKGIFIE